MQQVRFAGLCVCVMDVYNLSEGALMVMWMGRHAGDERETTTSLH
jgi:hypothetical protein